MNGNIIIPCRQLNKLFGITLDSPILTWKPHIDYLITKRQKKLDMMRCMAGMRYGVSKTFENISLSHNCANDSTVMEIGTDVANYILIDRLNGGNHYENSIL